MLLRPLDKALELIADHLPEIVCHCIDGTGMETRESEVFGGAKQIGRLLVLLRSECAESDGSKQSQIFLFVVCNCGECLHAAQMFKGAACVVSCPMRRVPTRGRAQD